MAGLPQNGVPGDARRAPRFVIQVPMRYRAIGQVNWLEGKTENISRSGVLFRGEGPVDPNRPVEMTFILPVEISDEAPAEVICFGHVVRKVSSSDVEARPALAAMIEDYCFVRVRDVLRPLGLGSRR